MAAQIMGLEGEGGGPLLTQDTHPSRNKATLDIIPNCCKRGLGPESRERRRSLQ